MSPAPTSLFHSACFPGKLFPVSLGLSPPILSVHSNFISMASACSVPGTVCASLSRICISGSGRAGSAAHKVGGGIVGCVVGAADQVGGGEAGREAEG